MIFKVQILSYYFLLDEQSVIVLGCVEGQEIQIPSCRRVTPPPVHPSLQGLRGTGQNNLYITLSLHLWHVIV